MKDTAKLNKLAIEYSQSPCSDTFSEIVMLLRSEWKYEFARVAKKLWTTPSEIEALYEDTLMRLLRNYDANHDFHLRLSKSLKNARIDYLRKIKRRTELEYLSYDNDAPTSDIADEYELESEVLSKKKADQRELIDSLCDPGKVDSVTKAIVTNFSRYDSINALAKELGIHHEVVKRKLRKIARNFDANAFGDYRDYLYAS